MKINTYFRNCVNFQTPKVLDWGGNYTKTYRGWRKFESYGRKREISEHVERGSSSRSGDDYKKLSK